MQVATEMAVLSTVHHPNIVSVFCCLTDMVEAAGAHIQRLRARGPMFGDGASLDVPLSTNSMLCCVERGPAIGSRRCY
jgi:hypothetical protein